MRGINNNNPGNIRNSNIKYQGEIISTDKDFKQFESMEYGYRAMFMLLYTYQIKHGLNTIREIINRYAPSIENNTESYIDFVSKQSGIGPDTPLNVKQDTIIEVVMAMSWMENGVKANRDQVREGWLMFLKSIL